MARVLLILSIVLTLVTAGLGFVAKQKVDALSDAMKSKVSMLHQTETKLKKSEEDLGATKKDLEAAKQEAEEKTAEAAKAVADAAKATTDLATANAAVEAKTKELDDLREKLKTPAGVDPGQIAVEIDRLKAELAKAQTELAESKQVQETLTQRTKDAEDKAATQERVVNAYKFQTVKAGLSGRVLAYNPGWNFVVLSIGDKAGLKSGVNMVVQRGNAMIAKVKVSTVEPNTAIADVLPGTMRGGAIEPGDTVIYEGAR